MAENVSTTDSSTTGTEPRAARLRDALRRYNPLYLGPLGFLSIPAEYFDGLAFLDVFGIFYLFFLWIFVGPIVDIGLRSRIEGTSEPTDWIEMGDWKTLVVALGTMPLVFLNPLVLFQDLRQFLGGWLGALRQRGALPDAETYDQSVSYRLPFDGEWTVVNGSPDREYSHSWIYPNQRYAYDFVITDDEGRTKPADAGSTVEEYYCYDESILAPAEGIVVDAFDAALESTRANGFSHPAKRDIRGGYVVLKHADDEYSLLAHLTPGSVPVEIGECVQSGQEIGRCGHSGNSSEPHLHFQVQDHPTFELAVSLPIQFETLEIDSPGKSHTEDLVPGAMIPDGVHDQAYVVAGQRVAHAEDHPPKTDREDGTESTPDVVSGIGTGRVFKQFAVGLSVAGIVLFVARIIGSGWPLVGALFSASAIGLLFGIGYRHRAEKPLKTRTFGLPLGVGAGGVVLAGVLSAGVGSGGVVGILLVAGLVAFLGVAEYERYRSRSVPAVAPTL
jgi:hypothetical protein